MTRNQIIIIGVIGFGFGFAFIFLGLGSCEVWAAQMLAGDTVDLAIEYKTAYPGHFTEVTVLMKNPVPISAFNIHITLGCWDIINFHTTDIDVDSVWVPVDTCPGPDTCFVDTCKCGGGLPDTCRCMYWDHYPVREIYLDTVRSLISKYKFSTISCHGDTGDTNLPYCKWATMVAIAGVDTFIPARANYDTLFRFGVDLSCISDADTGREVCFLVSPGFSFFSDNLGSLVPFKYHMGELFAWWSVPGDASNDSVVNTADIVFEINYQFANGPGPCVMEAADPDSSCSVNAADIVYLINYMFNHGPAPKPGWPCP